jgi:uncharacterized protein YecE (DUF72 family)
LKPKVHAAARNDLPLYIGTAGWTLPRASAGAFAGQGSHLQRYAGKLSAVEINSSFYRPHRPATYARWAESVPTEFRFAVKMPKHITHERLLRDVKLPLLTFLAEVAHLGPKLGCLLVQLPPSFAFERRVAAAFFKLLRSQTATPVACEPRHASWFEKSADKTLAAHGIARVAADPALSPTAAQPDDWSALAYYRLHGSPRVYYSTYTPAYLAALAQRLQKEHASGRQTWCIFDNTALGAATQNALELQTLLRP